MESSSCGSVTGRRSESLGRQSEGYMRCERSELQEMERSRAGGAEVDSAQARRDQKDLWNTTQAGEKRGREDKGKERMQVRRKSRETGKASGRGQVTGSQVQRDHEGDVTDWGLD